MRIVHYYARYLTHASGVTESINNWAEQSRRFGHDVEIWSAPATTVGSNDYIAADISRKIPHLGRGRISWIPVGLITRIKRGDWLYLHEGWTVSNLTAAAIGRLKGATVLLITHALDEAAMLADRVGVMSARPGRFLEIVPTGWSRERDSTVVGEPSFGALTSRLWTLLRAESMRFMGTTR